VFSDDTTSDIRDSYRALLADQVADDVAARQIIDEYLRELDEDEQHLLWLALAAAQSQVGRLRSDVRERALEIIDEGIGLELWEEAGPQALSRRRAALAKLRVKLTGPQPVAKQLRKPWGTSTYPHVAGPRGSRCTTGCVRARSPWARLSANATAHTCQSRASAGRLPADAGNWHGAQMTARPCNEGRTSRRTRGGLGQ
jgi:hypothetical protein